MKALEALLEHLPETSATAREKSPLTVDRQTFILANLYDLTLRKALGKKWKKHDSIAESLRRKAKNTAPYEQRKKEAEAGLEAYKKAMEARKKKKASVKAI